MNPTQWQQLKVAFEQARPLDPAQRRAYIETHCATDPQLRSEIESMLAAHDALSATFLSAPAVCLDAFDELADSESWVGKVLGPYRLVQLLGVGGTGEVYLAMRADAEFEQQVAIKLIRDGQGSRAIVARFRAERQILASLDHPNIAKLLDGGRTPQGQPYFVMEYVPGPTINDYCDQNLLSMRERLELFGQVCEGVQYAHQAAIIHRDLKPAHVLVVAVSGKPVVRIIDFGLAKAIAAPLSDAGDLTQFGTLMGTPDYMSPEQLDPSTKVVDTRADVYALGLILYLLLAGSLPFEAAPRDPLLLEKLLRRVRAEEPPRPSVKLEADPNARAIAAARGLEVGALQRLLRGDLDAILLKALQRDRERRYASVREFAADIRRYLNFDPVSARPASALYETRRFIRRHRIGTAFVAVTTLLGIAASGAGLLAIQQKREAQHAQHEAELHTAQALQAQSRLLTEAAAQRLKDNDLTGAQGIILAVLTDPRFAPSRSADALSIFQDVRAADATLAVLTGHTDMVIAAAYSPDGTRIVTGSSDRTARIWDARTGISLVTFRGHNDHVGSVAFSPDGERIVTASNDRTARVWDARTGASLAVLRGHADMVNSAAFSPDGTRIITGSSDQTVRMWDARTGRQLKVLARYEDMVYSAAYSSDGRRVVTACDDNTARVLDASTGAQLATLVGHGDRVNSAVFSPDGNRVVTSSLDKTARIWDARTGAALLVLKGHDDAVFAAAYSPDGEKVVTASGDKTARIWDARSGLPISVLSGHGARLFGVAYSRDGKYIVTASRDQTARVWDANPRAQVAVLSGHDSYVNSAAYSPDGSRIVTASRDKTMRIWNAATGAALPLNSGRADYLYSASYSPDGSRIVTASADKSARIIDAHSGALLAVLGGHEGIVYSAVYSPDGTRIVTASDDGTARIWDARLGTQLALLAGHAGDVFYAAYSPDGARIVTGYGDKLAEIWDARTDVQLARLSGHGDKIYSVIYSPDGHRLLTASGDRTARIWDSRSGAQLLELSGHHGSVFSAAYSPDGNRIVTASGDRTARIWDASTAEQLAVLVGHGDAVNTAVYSPDGSRILTASSDKTTRIWDARIQAGIPEQILWATAAQVDPLPHTDRLQLGLPIYQPARRRSGGGTECDRVAAAIYDPDRVTQGVSLERIPLGIAAAACAQPARAGDSGARGTYELGRALRASGDIASARQRFETAVSAGYRAALIDLADLLSAAPAGSPQAARAIALYEQAWQTGVPVAAFKLGWLLEHQGHAAMATTEVSQAWVWYQKGAQAGEPNALARLAEREEDAALSVRDVAQRDAQWLRAFSLYAAAAERADAGGWPDDAWLAWRHRRATLARSLEHEGMMQAVAQAYQRVAARAALSDGAEQANALQAAADSQAQ